MGELIDKLTILEIKRTKIKDKNKKKLILNELNHLKKEFAGIKDKDKNLYIKISVLMDKLSVVNKKLWEIEDSIRRHESKKDFGDEFIQLARQVYLNNDKRFNLKNKIDTMYNSEIQEVKEYEGFTA